MAAIHAVLLFVLPSRVVMVLKFVSWIAMVAVGLLVMLFAISNRTLVTLDLWPLPTPEVTVPHFVPVLAADATNDYSTACLGCNLHYGLICNYVRACHHYSIMNHFFSKRRRAFL